jgi:hypothetical protein
MSTRAKGRKAFLPRLERLEERDCPAFNIYYTSASLVIRGQPTRPFVNPGDGLQLRLVAGGAVQVREVSGVTTVNYGSYRPAGSIQVYLNNNIDHDFTFDLGGGRIAGNFLLSLGHGNTDVLSFPPHPDTISNGAIGGNVTILGGSGGELIALGTSEGFTGTSNLPLEVDGNTFLALSKNPTALGLGDILNINAGSELRGQLTASEVDNIDIGEFPAPLNTGAAFVRGDVFMSVARSGNVGRLDIFGEVDGNVVFQGSPAFDPVFTDSVIVEANGVVRGNVTAALGDGDGVFNILGTVQRNVTLSGAQGNDFVNLQGTVGGSAQLNLRSGNGTVQFTGTVGGNLGISALNGDNDLTLFNGAIGGGLTVNLGNGTNTAVIANAPGGQLNWTSGNATSSVTLGSADTTGSESWNATIQFGNNDDTFTLAGTPPGTTQTLSGLVDGGGRLTANTFVQMPNWVLTPLFILRNFP